MKRIDKHITFLLSSHDCVVIPNFGAFIAEYKAATLGNDGNKKPSKSLLFNTQLTRNDGLLINTLVENESLNYPEAKQEIEAYVHTLTSTLETEGSYTIKDIGRFRLDKAGFIQFHESEHNTSLLESYGLPSVELEKIERQNKSTRAINKNKILDYTLKTAAAAILILLVFYTSQPSIDPSKTNQAGLNPISDTPASEQVAVQHPAEESKSTPATISEETTAAIDSTPLATSTTIKEETVPQITYYHVIIGSLKTESAALLHLSLFQKEYPFKDIKIIEGNHRYRISAAHFREATEASTYIKTLKNLDPKAFKDAWTLHQ